MGGSGIMLNDLWSGFHNQAGLVHIEGISAGAFYENRFTTKELSDKGVIVALPFRTSAFAISYRSFGYSAFNTSKASLAYALKLSEKFSAGIQFNYHSIRIAENYGTQSNFTFEGGFLYRMNNRLSLAVHIYNPTRAKLAEFTDERIPSLLRMGAGYKFSDKVMLTGEVRKSSDANASIRAGIEYWVVPQVAVRAGFGSEPAMYSFGFGYKLNTFQLDVAAGYHQLLGFTPQIALTYAGKKK